MRAVDQRMADRLRRRGWKLTPPPPAPLPIDGEEPHPCIPVCRDPEMHAEGGHDV
jgi:hypothetical protein